MINYFQFDFDKLSTDEILSLILTENRLKKLEVQSLQKRLNCDLKLYDRLTQNIDFAKSLTGRLSSRYGAVNLDEDDFLLLKHLKSIDNGSFSLKELNKLIKSFDSIEVLYPSGIRFGFQKKDVLTLFLKKVERDWTFKLELKDFLKSDGYFYLGPDAGYLKRNFDRTSMAICFPANSIRIRGNQLLRFFDIFRHELNHVVFNSLEEKYFKGQDNEPLIDLISEAEAYATSFLAENGWSFFKKTRKYHLCHVKKELRGKSIFEIEKEAFRRIKADYIQLFLSVDEKKAFSDMIKKRGFRGVHDYEINSISRYIRQIKKQTLETSPLLDDFSIKTPDENFLDSANKYFKKRYSNDINITKEMVLTWSNIFKRQQKRILKMCQEKPRDL